MRRIYQESTEKLANFKMATNWSCTSSDFSRIQNILHRMFWRDTLYLGPWGSQEYLLYIIKSDNESSKILKNNINKDESFIGSRFKN